MHIRPFEADCGLRRFAVINLALRVIEDEFGPEHADTICCNRHPAPCYDYVLANPPFNESDRFRKDNAVRFFSLSASNWERARVGCRSPSFPPKSNATFTWAQHFIDHHAPHGVVGLVLANGSISSNRTGEADILGYQSRTQATLRDTLLPKLLSGELKTTN